MNKHIVDAAPNLLTSLQDILKLIDKGVLVRDISKDSLPGYFSTALQLVATLKKASDAVTKATK